MLMQSETAIFNACRTLFGKEVNLSHEFLDYLQPSGAKTAFRSQAKAHHPDLHANSPLQVRNQQTARFREIRQAYELILDFLDKRHLYRRAGNPVRPTQSTAYRRPGTQGQSPWRRPHPRPATAPSIPLEFGMYSYYLGKVTYQQLIEALVWQRRQRPTLGAIATRWGWLSDDKVRQILGHRGHAVRFGMKAVELGYLKPHQLEALLHHQRSLQLRIGQYFIDKGLLTDEEAEALAQSLKLHNEQVALRAKRRKSNGF